MGHHGRITAVLTAVAALIIGGGAGLAADRTGTNGDNNLVGTHGADRIEGKGGKDVLRGLAGDDRYVFANGWGADTLVEKVSHTVDGRRKRGGTDTLDFAKLTAGRAEVYLLSKWGQEWNYAKGGDGSQVTLGASPVENVVGAPFTGNIFDGNYDVLVGGAGKNVINTGGGGDDFVLDFGGWDDGPGGEPEVAASNDTYTGLARNAGLVFVQDWRGNDTVDLRPLRSDEVSEGSADMDWDGDDDSLVITAGNVTVTLIGQLGPIDGEPNFASLGYQGTIETILYADGPVQAGGARRSAATSADAEGSDRARAAERRVPEAWRALEHGGLLVGGARR